MLYDTREVSRDQPAEGIEETSNPIVETITSGAPEAETFEQLLSRHIPFNPSSSETSMSTAEEQEVPDFERVSDPHNFMQVIDELNRNLSPESIATRLGDAMRTYQEEATNISQRRAELGLPPDQEIEASLAELEQAEQGINSGPSSPHPDPALGDALPR